MSYRCHCCCEKLRNVKLYLSDKRAYEVGTNLTIGPVDYSCGRSYKGKGFAGNVATIIRELIKKNPNEVPQGKPALYLKPSGSGGRSYKGKGFAGNVATIIRELIKKNPNEATQAETPPWLKPYGSGSNSVINNRGWIPKYRYGKGEPNYQKGRAPLIRYPEPPPETDAQREERMRRSARYNL
jgi:hypothetical protein